MWQEALLGQACAHYAMHGRISIETSIERVHGIDTYGPNLPKKKRTQNQRAVIEA